MPEGNADRRNIGEFGYTQQDIAQILTDMERRVQGYNNDAVTQSLLKQMPGMAVALQQEEAFHKTWKNNPQQLYERLQKIYHDFAKLNQRGIGNAEIVDSLRREHTDIMEFRPFFSREGIRGWAYTLDTILQNFGL